MTDEATEDNSDVSRPAELIRAELVRAVLDLLDALHAGDAILEEHPRDAVHRAQTDMFNFVIRAGRLRRDLGLAPPNSHLPGDAVARSVTAFADLNRGIVDPVLEPAAQPGKKSGGNKLILKDQLDRVEPAVAMELLIMAGAGVEEAAAEAARLLKGDPLLADVDGDHTAAIKRWWRIASKGDADSWATEKFNTNVAEAKHQVAIRGGTAADLVKIAHGILRRWRPSS
jgi:hypothetical protein